jgi:hypothetical protein
LLQAQTTSKLADIHGAVAALQTLLPPFPPMLALVPMTFDRDWCSAVSGSKWKIDIDAATGMHAHVTYIGDGGGGYLTLRGAAPLPRPRVVATAGDPKQEPFPAYRIVVVEAANVLDWCDLGFVPSHHHVPAGAGAGAAATVTPIVGGSITDLGGWYIGLYPSKAGYLSDGWTAVEPADSVYATRSKVPPVPEGSAVEFAVDYTAGTCRVAFYMPAAVASGFVQAPYAKMELRFARTENDATDRAPRPVPVLAHSGVELYPAAQTYFNNVIWRFAA